MKQYYETYFGSMSSKYGRNDDANEKEHQEHKVDDRDCSTKYDKRQHRGEKDNGSQFLESVANYSHREV